MAPTVELLILLVNVLLLVLVGVLGYLSRDIVDQVEKNTRLRRHIVGDEQFGGEGRLDDFDELHSRLREDHEETRRYLQGLSEDVHQIREALVESDAVDVEFGDADRDYRITD